MITLFQSSTKILLNEIKDVVAKQLQQLPRIVSTIGSSQTILRYEWTIEDLDILNWLHNQVTVEKKIYWSDREQNLEVGGIHSADSIRGQKISSSAELFNYMQDRLSADNPRLRYFGGFSFNNSVDQTSWDAFGDYSFIVPEFEISQEDENTIFAFNICIDKISDENVNNILNRLDDIDFSQETTFRNVPKVLNREDRPNKDQWNEVFENVITAINETSLEKVVLARQSTFEFDVNIRAAALLKHLKDMTPHCFHFAFQLDQNLSFIGATPEQLYKRDGININSEAIAGTRPRGENDEQDKQLMNDLLSSEKEKKEHAYVVEAIANKLKPLCQSISHDQSSSLLKLKGYQHLITKFKGQLDAKTTDAQIVAHLHPTPAVAGFPIEESIDYIKKAEPFTRGWYAAPVGYVGFDSVEFAVAIRSALIEKNYLHLYAGAGIIAESDATSEWDEIENKISRFIKVFKNDNS